MKTSSTSFFIVLCISITSIFFFSSCTSQDKTSYTHTELLGLSVKDHTNLALHIHPYLRIFILGQEYPIPTDIGISSEEMRVIHTHDATGKIHIEAPVAAQFYLKDFFFIWDQLFNENCIFTYCVDDDHTLTVFVNGEQSDLYGEIPLHDGDQILIVYE